MEEEDDPSYFDELDDLEGYESFSKFMRLSSTDLSKLKQYTNDEMSLNLAQEMNDSVVVHIPRPCLMPSTKELYADFYEAMEETIENCF